MKKLLSLVLTLAMLCTLYASFGITASAEAPSGDFVTFSSPNSFTITARKCWDGNMYYSTDGADWKLYNGDTTLTAAQIYNTGDYYLCFRGENNSVVSSGDVIPFWTIAGSDVACNGSIENLRDYTGEMPMRPDCYAYMFYGCDALIKAPELPATDLTAYCYSYMFASCDALKTAPELPATDLAENCYYAMFNGCTGIKLYEDASDAGYAPFEWGIPAAANAEGLTYWNTDMFLGTGGDFTGAPEVGKTYYMWTPAVKREANDVVVTYQAGAAADTVYSVDIAWGSMEFTYTDASQGTWNPLTHEYAGAVPAGWSCDTDANKITVTNRSNVAVYATLSYTEETAYSTISGSFTETSGTANDNKLELATAAGTEVSDAPTASAMLTLSGALTSGVTSTKIGSVTVTIGDDE